MVEYISLATVGIRADASVCEGAPLDARSLRHLGSIYTPRDFAKFLTSWAVQSSADHVLDIGVGEGVFVFSAYRQLLLMGASEDAAQEQIYGAEIDDVAYNTFLSLARQRDLTFPNVHLEDFFALDFPAVDAVIGNPPYVRRSNIRDVAPIRERVLRSHAQLGDNELSRQADLYVYFLLESLARLKPGGRCAVITADPWLTVGYGRALKRYLQLAFHIECLITVDRRVFENAEVKPVMLLATKLPSPIQSRASRPTYFVRVKNGLGISVIEQSIRDKDFSVPDLAHTAVDQTHLTPDTPWSTYFRAPELCEKLANHPLMTPVSSVANTRIGIQTLAKDFFVLTAEAARQAGIEPEYLAPLAQSARFFSEPTIEPDTPVDFHLFYCSKIKAELVNTRALEYIIAGERREVGIRGKEGVTVIGFHSKGRIQRSHRKYWYDLRSALERRGRASILIPRLVYKSFRVIWNRGNFVPGELFLEFLPLPLFGIEDEVYLAVLASSVTEIMLRVNAQVYGGGTYNINPGQVKKVPILNVNLLTDQQRANLRNAYIYYLNDPSHDRAQIDKEVCTILGLGRSEQRVMQQVLNDLLLIAISLKISHGALPASAN